MKVGQTGLFGAVKPGIGSTVIEIFRDFVDMAMPGRTEPVVVASGAGVGVASSGAADPDAESAGAPSAGVAGESDGGGPSGSSPAVPLVSDRVNACGFGTKSGSGAAFAASGRAGSGDDGTMGSTSPCPGSATADEMA
jgi:hypothetical protein